MNRTTSKIKILFLDHSAVRASEQVKYEELSKFNDLKIKLIAPVRWRELDNDIALEQRNGKTKNYELIPCKTLFTGYQHRSLYVSKLSKVLRNFNPAIIFVFAEPCDFWILQILLFQKIDCPKAKVVFHTWQNINYEKYPYKFQFLYSIIEKLAFRYCRMAIVRNEEAISILRDRGFKKEIFYERLLGLV